MEGGAVMQTDESREKKIGELFDAQLNQALPEARRKLNADKLRRLGERAKQSETSERISAIRDRLHRNK
jgi:hypothetical protein